ncbi:MAG: DNA replication protein DnaD [Firmicutes bacterium HGW-Firmicutes-1]|jgi:DnaD/phage-associated family protein|nr:MAG: DNA replication protein DnaD [Firmicutes bacterium HGW-Firmicutes-1]
MNTIKINPSSNKNYIFVPNWFVDDYMANSNGDFVKVYLLLLRYDSNDTSEFSTTNFADQLHLTDSDIIRALKYWASMKILSLEEKGKEITAISFLEPNQPESEVAIALESKPLEVDTLHLDLSTKPQYNMEELSAFVAATAYKDLIYVTGRYLGKILNQQDLGTLISFHDWLGLPIDVIEWLIEYCASNDHRNMRYIEKVAIEWADNNIDSLDKAKVHTETYNKKYYAIKKALGFANRNPVLFEIKTMDKWIEEYRFDLEIILEACNRTMKQAPNGSFNYTDKILTQWYKKKVHTLQDIKLLDQEHNSKSTQAKGSITPITSNNKFINFEQRDYDFDKIEKKAMEMVLKENTEGGYK